MITPENKSSNLISEKFCIQDGIIVIPKNTTIVSFQNNELKADIPPLSYLFVRLKLK